MKRITRVLMSLGLAVLLVSAGFISPVQAQTPGPGPIFTNPNSGQPANQTPQAPVFDGKVLYKAAFEALRDSHMMLADPKFREAWVKEWETKFDSAGDLKTEAGTDKAIARMVASLKQRFDYFFDKEDTERANKEVDATLVGIGVVLKLSKAAEIAKALPKDAKPEDVEKALRISKDNQLMIDEPIEGGPAEKAGLKAGDIIRKVNGKEVEGLSFKEVIELITGKEGSEVEIEVDRLPDSDTAKGPDAPPAVMPPADGKSNDAGDVKSGPGAGDAGSAKDAAAGAGDAAAAKGQGQAAAAAPAAVKPASLTVKISRAKVSVPVVKFRDLGDGVSYIKLRNFVSKNTVTEMRDALKKAAGGKALIIDLRGNGGGSLTFVLTITGMILEDGPVLTTKSRLGDLVVESEITLHKNFVLRIDPDDADPKSRSISIAPRTKQIIPNDMPIIVLVDEGSASASEILSGVLQHNRRAAVVGKPTVGKGVGQTVIELPYGRQLRVTTFEFIPGRTPNDWIGVIPDHEVERGDNPKVDGQLEKARELTKPMIERTESMRQKRDEQKKKHTEEFEEELKKRTK